MFHNKHLTVFFIGFGLLSSIGGLSACKFSVVINQELSLEGFHRNLTYKITIGTLVNEASPQVFPYTDCVIGLFQSLPSGIYTNNDELSELKRVNRLNAISKKTNIELPADQAEPLNAYIVKKLYGPKTTTWLPVHARYHRASVGGGYALNDIEPPQLYMRCPDNRLDVCEQPFKPAKFLCNAREKCSWKEIPFQLYSDTPLTWSVPVGDLNHYYTVAVVTGTTVTLGSLYLLLTLINFKFILAF
ncbi:phosphatidylinositol glycan anchor biosynthesis class X [Anticarsia gemmatalis]|uniref:phosphatidylinositol glycan anchor biosynthesis class X n=1 Tax=Anticarsia gemmatalis TaxID=129554 RepID=UPI003F7780FB